MPYLGLSSVYPKVFIASLHRSAVPSKKFGLSWRALSEMRKVSDHLTLTGTAGAAPIFTK